ncbi:MAG: Ig-like domain-containing protein, partial [Vicinamibacterales bacterium]
LNVDIVMLGRGTFEGRTLSENGRPLAGTNLRITSLTDQSQYGAITDTNGRFLIPRIPVGNLLVEAVNTRENSRIFVSENIRAAGETTTRDLVLLSVETTQITVRQGAIRGHILRNDGATPVTGVPVIVYYTSNSQPGALCPPPAAECAIAMANADAQGAFAFTELTAGQLRIETFDQASFQRGEVRTVLAADGTSEANIVLTGGLGTVRGVVLDPEGLGVAGVRVGGGMSLTTTDATGQFTLVDVPVGRATLVAVSDTLGSRGTADVDILRPGEQVNATIVLQSLGGVGGVIRLADGTTPAAGISVYVFTKSQGGINVAGTVVTDAQGRYSLPHLPLGDYYVSAFTSDFSDGNVGRVAIKFNHQVAKADVTFRGGGGTVTGVVYDDDGVTPLPARVSVSGDQLVIAGGRVGVAFQHVANFRIVDTDFTTGRFSLGGLWVGPFTLRAAGQFSPDPIALDNTMPAAGATVVMDIRLQSTSQVAGRVFLPDGVTPAGANLIVKYKSDEFRTICSTGSSGEDSCTSIPQGIQEEIVVTDADGRFGVPLVNAGTFTLTVEEPATGRSGQIHGSVKAGERIDVSVRLVGLGAINLRIRASDAVTPIPGARVVIQQLAFPNKTLTAFADDDGVLPIGGGDSFSEGAFVVTATDVRNGFTGRASGRIEHDGDNIALDVFLYTQTGVVYGNVYRSDGLTPVANAEVVVAGVGGPLAFTLTNAAGGYRVEQIPLGAVTVDVFEAATARRGFATGLIPFDGLELPVNVWQLAMGVVRGTVIDQATMAPLRGWEIDLSQTAPGGRPLPSLRSMSSVDGSFSFPGVSKGSVTLSARQDGVNGFGTATGSLEREGQVVSIPLLARIVRPLFGGIEGRVFDPTGQPAANSLIDICAGTCSTFAPLATLTSAADGAFSVGQLPLGRYEVRARAQASLNVGSSQTEIAFDEEVAAVTVVMIGLSEITGQVVRSDNSPAGNVDLRLEGEPSSGCAGACLRSADSNGFFTFSNVPARSFTITAVDAVSGFKGVAGDSLNPGETRTVRIVLEPTGSVRGRVLRQNLSPAVGVTVDLATAGRHLFLLTDANGRFSYETTPLGPFTIAFEDSVGSGVASAVGTILGAVDIGDVRLDEAPPAIGTVTPAALATAVPLNQAITLVFTERVQPGTITTANITLSDELGNVPGTLATGGGDTTATFTPLTALRESTRYSIRVTGVRDLVGKVMQPDHVSTFMSVDLTPPSYLDISPVANTSGVPLYSPVRLKYSEPIDPTRTNGPPITLTGPGGVVDGRIDYLFGNTVAVFTPARPLAEDAVYQVHAAAASDLAGNAQAQALDYTFGTTDRTPPTVASLAAPSSVIENTIARVIADVGASHDVSFVDFFINDGFAATSRTLPFALNLQAIPAFGHVGDQIRVSAIATDTSGNRGTVPATAAITVLADQPPAVVITTPASGLTAANGARIVVTVRSTDDVGVQQSGFKAQTGRPQDGAIAALTSPATDHTEAFGFNVPLNAAPGSTILIEASAADTAGHVGQAVPVSISVLDAVAPTVHITGASTGQAVRPGQSTTIIVSAQDLGGVGRIDFSTTGVVVLTDARTIDPAPASALASFTFVVPASARPGESITLQASATDRAGNVGVAASVILPVADTVAPTIQLRTASGRLEMVPGAVLNLIADASDGISVSRVELVGSGAFTMADARPVTPPAGDAQVPFSILVPDTLTAGAVLNLQARAYDLAGNVSSPAFLSVSVSILPGVTLPASTIVSAGNSVPVVVTLPGGAPPAGVLVTFTTADATVATVTPSAVFSAGETSRTIAVAGQSGGTTQVSARIQGVERAAMTVAVAGGNVDGVVFDTLLNPVAGAQVTVSNGLGTPVATVSDADGRYSVSGIYGPEVTVRAFDPQTSVRGFVTATMNRANGFAHVNVVLIPAGSIRGTVHRADAVTAVGDGVRIDIYASGQLNNPLATTFTDAAGGYEFPLVAIGSYVIDASASDGHRGRSNATVGSGADEVIANVTYLGLGSVIGTVFDANGSLVPNALL